MPTTVEVYNVNSDGTTASFLGFGSLLDPAVVFLHLQTPSPPPDGPIRPGPIRPGPIRPGPIRPDLSTQPIVTQRLHDESSAQAGEPSAPGGRARCRIRSGLSVLTLDGDILAAPVGVSAPTAVQLDLAFSGDIDQVQVPQGPGHPTAEEAAAAVIDFVTDAALSDPPAPTDPPPQGADVDGYRPHPGRRPWYCVICPGAFGC